MKHLTYILSCIMMAILATACSDDDLYKELEAHKKGIVVKLTSGDMDTKAHLYSQSNWHHVEKVYAILYYCGSNLNATTNPATTKVVHSELLKKQGKIWVPNKDEIHQLRDTFHLALPETYAHLLPGKYMVLCVGIDDESGKTYNLGYDNDTETSKPEFARKDATLDKAIAALKTPASTNDEPVVYDKDNKADPNANKEDGDLIKYGHPGMAHSEFFAGWTEFTFKPGDLNMVEVELRRRVAGVLCYLSDIPYKLNNGNTTFRVTKVRLNLNGNQNTQIGLIRKLDNGKPAADDFGSDANASKVLCEFDLTSFGSIDNKNLLYKIPTAHLQGRNQKENTILMGAYMLPMAEITTGTDLKTLSIELLGKEYSDNESGNIQPNSNEVSITSFPVLFNKDGQDKHSFPIRPNMIYHIGQKLDDNNTEGDYPESLAGTKVSVNEEPWSNAEINMEFPSVPVNPVMRILCSRGEYKVQPRKGVQNDKYYIFDCMGTDTNYLVVSPSILYENWKVKVVSESIGDERMILFKDPKNPDDKTKWTDSYTGKGTMYIPIVMTDYTKLKGKDTRSEKILITSLVEKDGKLVEEATSTSSLMVEQYNALIVEIDNGNEGYRGFSHYNFGTIRNLVTGEITNDGEKIQWGYFSTEVITPFRYYGNENYKEFIDWRFIGNFKHSAMQVCSMGKNGQKLKVDYDKVTSEDPFWYLPADWELDAFMKYYSQNHKDEVHNITRNEYYWTCNQTGLHWCAFSQRVKTGNKFEWDRANKKNWFYARQACIVN